MLLVQGFKIVGDDPMVKLDLMCPFSVFDKIIDERFYIVSMTFKYGNAVINLTIIIARFSSIISWLLGKT